MEWINTKDKLPRTRERVLFYIPKHENEPYQVGYLDIKYGDAHVFKEYESIHINNVTHWMTLPKPPKRIKL